MLKLTSPALLVQVHQPALLSGRTLSFTPLIAQTFGVSCAIVFHQIDYLAHGSAEGVRISYQRLHRQLGPGVLSLRWLVKCVKELEAEQFISVERTGRVNRLRSTYPLPNIKNPLLARMLVFPDLASKVGLLQAVVLQQVHLRCHFFDGSFWAAKPVANWAESVFPFISLSTFKRVLADLQESELVYSEKSRDLDAPHRYLRVNYRTLAEQCGYELDLITGKGEATPYRGNGKTWVDPLFPTMPYMAEHALID